MEIFIGNLPQNTTAVELRRLLGDAGLKARYRIFRKTMHDGSIKCYSQALVEPERVAQEVIAKLHNSTLNRHQLEVRRYHERSLNNERRAPLWSGKPWIGLDRRKSDRRGKG